MLAIKYMRRMKRAILINPGKTQKIDGLVRLIRSLVHDTSCRSNGVRTMQKGLVIGYVYT
jgi:hypothetical protein